ncbi:hypothetical protein [Butyrivibrio sp. AE2032]|uniref:hypothetical protein n=1 Tax=Butyrivibrio sp. AE2032 TaxID=1458463 RepID=UPI0005566C09|nr:hypothetical protein [Butyrivibrio sp. AE2032]
MDKQEKIKLAITAGIAAVILLILVLFLALSGKKNNDGEMLEENIAKYSSGQEESTEGLSVITASEEKSDESDLAATGDSGSTGSSVLTYSETKNTAKAAISGNSFYATSAAVLKNVYRGMKYDVNAQLKDMYTYWADGNMDAVRDLAHLERYETMSLSLNGSKDFYYYGDKNSEGKPDGMGLAVYANDQYYFGKWSNGLRNGDGTWVSFYPNYSTYVVKEHMYTGQWANDLPDGKGQEHYDYDPEYMNQEDLYLQNAIGGFSSGKYNGDMYIITIDKDGNTIEWLGSCEGGDWKQVNYAAIDDKGKIPVLSERENSDNHIFMSVDGAKSNGVTGIITGGQEKQ